MNSILKMVIAGLLVVAIVIGGYLIYQSPTNKKSFTEDELNAMKFDAALKKIGTDAKHLKDSLAFKNKIDSLKFILNQTRQK